MYRFAVAVCLTVSAFVSSLSLADIPKLINYQGMLTESDGSAPVADGTYDINFKIYNASSAGDMRWEETQTDVAVTNGLFNVILGGATVGGMDLDFSEEYWLEVTVEGEQMGERLRFTSVGYAYRARVADSAVVAGSSAGGVGGWVDDGSAVRLQTSTDEVGIGTASPSEKLTVAGGGFGVYPSLAEPVIVTNGYNVKLGDPDGIGNQVYLEIDNPGGKFVFENGNVGVGKTSPGSRLDIKAATGNSDGGLRITSSTNANPVVVLQDATPGDQGQIAVRAGNSDKVVLRANGDSYFNGGDIDVYNNEIRRYYGFPRPDYSSGWQVINQGQTLTFTHNLGGSYNDYVVDLMFYDNTGGVTGPHHYGYGGWRDNTTYMGAYWYDLDSSIIKVTRWSNDTSVDWVRVRIWVIRD